MTKLRKKYVIESIVLFSVALLWFFLGETKIISMWAIGCISYLNYQVYELTVKLQERDQKLASSEHNQA